MNMNEEYLKTARDLYTDLMRLQKKYSAEEAPEPKDMITDINAINSKYNANYCNAVTDIMRKWYFAKFAGVPAEEIRNYWTAVWQMHKRYAADKLEHQAKAFIDEQMALSAKYSGVYQGTDKPVERILLALADEIENPTLTA